MVMKYKIIKILTSMFANMNDDDDDDGDVLDAWYDDNAGYDGWKHVFTR